MQYSLVFAAAALAQLANAHEHQHGRFHAKREMLTETDVVYVTDVVTVTAGSTPSAKGNWNHHWSPRPYSSSVEPSSSSVESTSATPSTYSYVASSSVAAPLSESSSSSSATTLVTSISSTPSPSSYSSSYVAPSSYSSSSAAPSSYSSATWTSSSAAPSSTGISTGNLTPNGKKAGLSGFVGIQDIDAFGDLAPYISWYSDYNPNTPDAQGVQGIGMLWAADGSACGSLETDRLDTFSSMISNGTTPEIMFGFYEPDCDCPDSSQMSTSSAASDWDSLIAPLADKGTVLGSPSMCKQYNEDFLTPFNEAISTTWDVTSIHINKPNISEAQKDVEYYVSTYGKPIWVSEFACVNDQPSWEPCTDQTQINEFINDVVSYFEGNDNVVAYGPSNGAGLGDVWPLTDSSGALTSSGQTYLSAIKGL